MDKALQEKKALVIRAEGEAAAAKLITDALRNNPAYLELRKLEAAREIATNLSEGKNKAYLDSSSLMMPCERALTSGCSLVVRESLTFLIDAFSPAALLTDCDLIALHCWSAASSKS